jgi:hypothetical protein
VSALYAIGQLTIGLRFALTLFAAMSLLVPPLIGEPVNAASIITIDRWRLRGANMLAFAILLYSPAHTAWLMGHAPDPLVSRSLDALATGLCCICFIHWLAARALKRGVSMRRVRRGAWANAMVMVSFVGTAWLIR